MHEQHSRLTDTVEGEHLTSKELLQDLLEEVKIADAIYERSLEE